MPIDTEYVLDLRGHVHQTTYAKLCWHASAVIKYLSQNIAGLISDVDREGTAVIALLGILYDVHGESLFVDLLKEHMNVKVYPVRIHAGYLDVKDNRFYLKLGPAGIADLCEATYINGYMPRRAFNRFDTRIGIEARAVLGNGYITKDCARAIRRKII